MNHRMSLWAYSRECYTCEASERKKKKIILTQYCLLNTYLVFMWKLSKSVAFEVFARTYREGDDRTIALNLHVQIRSQ